MLWGDPSGSFFMAVVSRGGVEVHPWASISGCSLIPDCIGETFHFFNISIHVGTSQSEVYLGQQPKNKWWDCPYGGFGHWQGRRGRPGHGDYPLSPWPGKGGVIRCALHFTPVRLSWTECSSGENICKLTLPPMGVFQLRLSGCNHSFIRHVNHPIPLRSAVPSVAAPLFPNTGCLVIWRGRWGAKGLSLPPGSIVEKLLGGAPPVRSHTAVSSSLSLLFHQEESSQTEKGPSLSLALMHLQSITWAKVQL